MPSDIVDFAPAGGRSRQAPSASLPLAVLGAALGAASLLGDWQTVRLPAELIGPESREFALSLLAAGVLTTPYVITLFLLVTTVTIALFGEERARSLARLAALALASCGLVLLGVIGQMLQDGMLSEGLYLSDLADQTEADVQWGFYAAAGAMLALGAAALLNRTSAKPLRQEPEPADGEAGHEADDAMQLSVIVEPVSRRAR